MKQPYIEPEIEITYWEDALFLTIPINLSRRVPISGAQSVTVELPRSEFLEE